MSGDRRNYQIKKPAATHTWVAFLLEQVVTKEEVIAAIRACTRKLGRIPTRQEFREMVGVSVKVVCNRFGSFGQAVRDAGFEPKGPGYHLKTDALLKDWGAVARKLGQLPTKDMYTVHGHYSTMPFESRWKYWRQVAQAFRHLTGETGTEKEWSDVLAMIEARYPRLEVGPAQVAEEKEEMEAERVGRRGPGRPPKSGKIVASSQPRTQSGGGQRWPGTWYGAGNAGNDGARDEGKRPLLSGRTVYGPLLRIAVPGLAHEPMDELGVVYVFGMVAHKLGFTVLRTQSTFPDCEALREIQPGRWQRVRIEFEYESRNFVKHGHNKNECDLIVCWRHNWLECPKELEIVELRKVLREGGIDRC